MLLIYQGCSSKQVTALVLAQSLAFAVDDGKQHLQQPP